MIGSDCMMEVLADQSIAVPEPQSDAFADIDVGTLVLHGTRNGYQVSDRNATWIPAPLPTDMIGQDEETSQPPFGTSTGPQADLIGLLLPGLDYMV